MVQRELRDDNESSDRGLQQEHDEAVRIVLLGDPAVGKTSLIHSLVNDEFDPNLPARIANITIPAELTPENVPINIVDYSEQEQSLEDLREQIEQANVICLVYVAGDNDGLGRVASHWIPTVRRFQKDNRSSSSSLSSSYKPMILVANKSDLLTEDAPLDMVTSVIQEFIDIEAFIEVSALNQKNVVELFSAAQKAVTYPLAPLFDPKLRVLTKKCRNALVEIFKLSDHDRDGLLNDHELNLFQENCFGTPLQKDALDDLKLIIKQSTIDGIANDSLTQSGFLFLHALSIDKGRLDFTWQVIRKFNYDNQVNAGPSATSDTSKLSDSNDESHQESPYSLLEDSIHHLRLESEPSETESEEMSSQVDVNWIREHQNIVKAGVALTAATLFSILAVRFLIQNSSRSWS